MVDDIGSAWSSAELNLTVPFPNRGQGSKSEVFNAGILHYRSIVSVIKEKMSDSDEFLHRHFRPYQHLWQPNLQRAPVQVYGEMYSSKEFLLIQENVQSRVLNEVDAGLERVVVSLMFWSDVTLLANFGTAKLWPCYLFFGNDSKHDRSKPSANLCNHVAYFEKVSPSFSL
jgi:Plavaka transposase